MPDPMTASGLGAVWSAGWASEPDRVVLTDAPTARDFTAGELLAHSSAAASFLAANGVCSGDSVMLSGAPSARTAIAFIALMRLGAVAVPVNTAATSRELSHYAAVSGARTALADEPLRFDGITEQSLDLGLMESPPDSRTKVDLDTASAGDRALICFTSGTTGLPKGAPLTHGNVLAGVRALMRCWDWTPDDVLVSALPMFHVHGLLVALCGTLTAGARIVVHPRFDPGSIIDSARGHGATLVFGVPTMWSRLVECGRLPELASLRLAVSGSAPLAPSLFAAVEAALGQAPVERYGMTETMILTSTPIDGERRAGTVGRPLPQVEVRLADDGVVEVRGPSVFAGYLIHSPDEPLQRTGFTDDGWFRTGDIGQWDGPDLRLVGRSSELIITGGYNVYPREVEDVLRTDEAVADVAVIGIPDDTWGERVVAAIVLADGAIADGAVIARWTGLCEESLAPYKRPRAWHTVTELPRNAMGKVQRDTLRDLIPR